MNRLHQTFWPSIDDALETYGQPIGDTMKDTKALTPLRFWQEVYIAATAVGQTHQYAKMVADNAVDDLAQNTGLVYSQNEGGNTPYPPNDVVGCLRGAIEALEKLIAIDAGAIHLYLPSAPDLIARSKKALGDC